MRRFVDATIGCQPSCNERHVTHCSVAVEIETGVIAGYYTLAAASLRAA
jgi:hypothetical protein